MQRPAGRFGVPATAFGERARHYFIDVCWAIVVPPI